ncbi:MAG: hypothetical protein EKK41_26030 [Hyphomicrobiales bacterium]|nr:MAG: hypothetical protein EKK41_26030 [Hyphomicrobiales bacterium]
MAQRDEREEEREFLADLKVRSGQDLAAWMAAITAQGFKDKNETIDWLRAQGFPFARASWLERIHSNGGRPIYLDTAPDGTRLDGDVRPALPVKPARPVPPPAANSNEPAPVSAASAPPVASEEPEAEARKLEALKAAAKGYRPLYVMLEGLIRQAVPQVALRAAGGLIVLSAPQDFAVVLPMPSEIRLGLALGARPHDANLTAARFKGAPAAITHMLVLKDARQINAELQALITAAQAEAGASAG